MLSQVLKNRRFSTLVVAEQFQGAFGNFKNCVAAASKFGEPVDVFVGGSDPSALTEAAKSTSGVNKVLVGKHDKLENPLAHDLAGVTQGLIEKNGYKRVIAAASTIGKDFIPRVGGLIDSQPITDVIDIVDADTFVRPIYAGNAISTVKSSDSIKLITIRPTNFEAAQDGGAAETEDVDVSGWLSTIGGEWIENQVKESDVPDLTSADIVVSGGRALKSSENFDILYELAKKLGNGAVGASRAAVDAGYVPNDLQVGQTGKVVAPKLYMAIGISGAIQHVAGMKDSKVIVAINKDSECPIFEIADYGLVGDLFQIVEEMNSKL